MNCPEFEDQWSAYLSGTLDAEQLEALTAHAKTCQVCRTRWDDHQEVRGHLAAMIQLKDGTDLATSIERDLGAPFSSSPISSASHIMNTNQPATPANRPTSSLNGIQNSSAALLAALLLGILIGVVGTKMFAGGSSSSAAITRMIELEMMGQISRSARNSMFGNTLGGLPGSGLFASVPALTGVTQTVLCIIVIAGIARTKLWESLAGTPLPGYVRAARSISLVVIVLGIAIAVSTLNLRLFSMPQAMRRNSREEDLAWILSAHNTAMELWSLACWLTIAFVVIAIGQVTMRSYLGRRHADVR